MTNKALLSSKVDNNFLLISGLVNRFTCKPFVDIKQLIIANIICVLNDNQMNSNDIS